MGRYYLTAGRKIWRNPTVKLTPEQKDCIKQNGCVVVKYPIEWPLDEFEPDFSSAYIDEGNTDIWGSGPYLKVPNLQGEVLATNRVFCPWGYPPDEVRLSRHKDRYRISAVQIERKVDGEWFWILNLEKISFRLDL